MTANITPRTGSADAPLSFAQELLWHLDRATPGMTAYNAPRFVRIRGDLDVSALRVALDAIVERHEILRTTYHLDAGALVQRVQPHVPFELRLVDVRAHAEPAAEADRLGLEVARTPFDFERDRFLRASLFRIGDAEWRLVLVSHHVVSDGWSRDILFRELTAAYTDARAGNRPELPPLPIQFADFATWQRTRAESADFERELTFWLDRLADAPVLQLPTTFARPAAASFDGRLMAGVLPADVLGPLRQFAVERGATLYMVLLAAYQTLLHRYTGQDDIITGSPVASRDLEEVEGLIGYFANTLAMRLNFANDPTFAQVVDQAVDVSMDAYEHADVPFEQVQLRLRAQGAKLGDAPLVRAVLTMEDTLSTRLALGDADVSVDIVDYGQAKFDLTLLVAERDDALRLSLWYRTDLFDSQFAAGMLRHFEALIRAALASPDVPVGRLAIVSDAERARLSAFGDGGVLSAENGGVNTRIDARIAAHARRFPHRVALRSGDAALTYGELDARADQLASRLRAAGASECVGLCEDHSIEAVIGIVGILRAGCAYVPLPPHAPVSRLRQQAADAQVQVVVCSAATVDVAAALDRRAVRIDTLDGPAHQTDASAHREARQSLAYVLFTSGSTGAPKGVAVTHANLEAYVDAILTRLELPGGASWTFGLASSVGADLGNTALFPALASGGTLDIVPRPVLLDPAAFGDYVASHPIDVLKITPSHLQALATGPAGFRILPRRWIVVGGEALSISFAREVVSSASVRLLNHYGPTETTVGCCTYEVHAHAIPATATQTVPIGRPLNGVRAHVVDSAGAPAPIGVPGELLISGAGVSAGYVAHPEWTAERFVRVADAVGGVAYRTGDRVRWLEHGELEFLGRLDDQVKIRGFRVELGEVEAAVTRCPGVVRAVVITRGEGAERQLAAFVQGSASAVTIREALSSELPEYMLPAEIIPVGTWPLTRSGKVDRMMLANSMTAATPTLAPRTETEQRLAEIWRAVLKREEIGVADSFFDLGGHSLLAIRVLGRISRDMGVRLPLRTLFDSVTIEALAQVIDRERRAEEDEAALRDALASVAKLSDSEVVGMLRDSSGEGR